MDLINKTAGVMVYEGIAYGPGKAIPFTDEHAGGRDVVALLGAGQLEASMGGASGQPSKGLTVEQLKAALTEKNIEFDAGAKKDALAALLDASAV